MSETVKPILTDPRLRVRWLECSCCAEAAGTWKQHWNRDTGFGICADCIAWLRGKGVSEAEIADLYGAEGVNFAPR